MLKPSFLFKCLLIGMLSAPFFCASPSAGSTAGEIADAEHVSAETGAAAESAQSEAGGPAAESADAESGIPAETETSAAENAPAEANDRTDAAEAQPSETEPAVPVKAIAPRLVWESSFPGPISWISSGSGTVAAASEFNSAACVYDLASGNILWAKKMPFIAANAPIYADGMTVFLHKNGSLSAYAASSGELKYDLLPFPYEKKAQEKNQDLIESGDRRQRAIQKAKAKAEERRLYQLSVKEKFSSRKPISRGSAASCGPYIVHASDSGLLTVCKDSGKSLNWYRLPLNSGLYRGIASTPAGVEYEKNYYLYIVSANGDLYTVNLEEPNEAGFQSIGGSKYEFRLPVAVRGFNLYLSSADGTVFCFDIKALRLRDKYEEFTPKPIWQWSANSGRIYQTDSQHDFLNKLCFDSLSRRLFVITDNKLHALSARFGKPLWTYARAGFRPVCSAVYWRGHVITAAEDSRLYFFDAETGAEEMTFELPGLPTAELLVAENKLLMGIKDKILCLNLLSE